MGMRLVRLTGCLLALSLLGFACVSCEAASPISGESETLQGTSTGGDNQKDQEYITEDEKWGRVAEGMLGNHGGIVSSYDGYLGYGYNMITSAYYNQNDINSAHPVVNMSSLTKANLVYVDYNTAFSNPKTYISNSTKEYAEALSAKAGVQGNYPLSGSFAANFEIDTSYQMQSNQRLVTLQANLQTRKDYIMENSPALLAQHVSTGFANSVAALQANPSEQGAAELIDRYGTHVLTNVTMGGRFDLNYLYTKKSTAETTDIEASLSASYSYVKGSTEGSVQKDRLEIEQNSKINIITYGGSVTVDPRSIESAMSCYKEWSEQVQSGSVTLVDASEVIPVWDIIKSMDPAYSEIAASVQAHCEKERMSMSGRFKNTKGVETPAQKYISEIHIGYGSSRAEALGMLYNQGILDTDIVLLDLNKNAGGAWIYAGYKTTTVKSQAVTHILADYYDQRQSTDIISNGYKMKRLDVDLNKGAGGKYIYLYYTKDPGAGAPITNIYYQEGDSIQGGSPNGYSGVRSYTTGGLMDFNKGTNGSLIYLWFKRG